MPVQRKAHVKRVFRIDPTDNTIDEDIWVDVLRIDLLPVSFAADAHTGAQGQIVNLRVYWNDDIRFPDPVDGSGADVQQENANGGRFTEQLTIRDPDDPGPDSEIKLWLAQTLKVLRGGLASGISGQGIWLQFQNGVNTIPLPDTGRAVTVIKVVNNDLGGTDLNPRETTDWIAYQQMLQQGTQDDTQHLDVEVTDRWRKNFQADEITGAAGQIVIWAPDNVDVERLFAGGDANAVDASGAPSLIRTDPLQTIVNVGFGGGAVKFYGDLLTD